MSEIVTVPPSAPGVVGVNVTAMVQFAPMARDAGHVLLSEKFGDPEVRLMDVMESAAVPVFVSVTDWGALLELTLTDPKVRFSGDKVTSGASIPVPESAMLCGLPGPLSVKISVPVRVPAAVGVKVTATVQVLPEARLLPQLFVSWKSPLAAMLPMVRVPAPVFFNVTSCAALGTEIG